MSDNLQQRLTRCVKPASLIGLCVLLLALGLGLRFDEIATNNFIFYDEGYYLNYSRTLGEWLNTAPPDHFEDWGRAVWGYIRTSLATGKALWFLLADGRFFFGGLRAWWWPRLLAAVFGAGAVLLTGRFAQRWTNNNLCGWLALGLASILPSLVFYSRIGMQETLSTLLVLTGFYCYLFPREFSWKTFAAGLAFAGAFFSNYRLIILPVLIIGTEIWMALSESRRPDGRKLVWCLLAFAAVVVLVGDIDDGLNTRMTFSWMFHQADRAGEHFSLVNALSYPYYLFRLENVVFGGLFFANLAFLLRRQWRSAWPFVLVAVYMLIFSLPGEKAARYLCAMLPFAVIAVTSAVQDLWHKRQPFAVRVSVLVLAVFMTGGLTLQSWRLVKARSDYRTSAEYLIEKDGDDVRFLSSQPYVHKLYVPDRNQVLESPRSIQFAFAAYEQGARYLVIGPQAYVSLTESRRSFQPPLAGYLGFVVRGVPPLVTYPHFPPVLLERFVFEHNQNLLRSIAFLREAPQQRAGELKVYDLQGVLKAALLMAREQGVDLGR